MKLLALAFDCFHGMRRPSKLRWKWVGLALAASMPSLSAVVAAPDAPASQVSAPRSADNVALEEIVVTAQKKRRACRKYLSPFKSLAASTCRSRGYRILSGYQQIFPKFPSDDRPTLSASSCAGWALALTAASNSP